MTLDTVEARELAIEPAPRRRSTLLRVCPFILSNEFCERLAFYGLSTNLVIYLTRVMGEDSGFAAVQVNLFEGTCYLTPLLGAWLADAVWGRYKTIFVFSCIYLVGMVMLAVTAFLPGLTPPPDQYPTALQNMALYTSLYIVALGTGGIKPNVSAFGADQFDESDPQDRKEKTSFFNWFYFSINLGSLLAVTVIVWVQENVSWSVGFAIPAACMLLAIAVFVAGSSQYMHVPPTESPISRVFKVMYAAVEARREAARLAATAANGPSSANNSAHGGTLFSHLEHEEQEEGTLTESLLGTSPNNMSSLGDYTGENNGYMSSSRLTSNSTAGSSNLHRSQSFQWMDAAIAARGPAGSRRFTRRQVEEVKLVLRMVPIFCTTILYWTIYMQMGSFFVVQGSCMDRKMNLPGGGSFIIPAASMSVINTVAIVVLIPMYDKLLIPLLKRMKWSMTLLRRIGWGLVVCVMAMLVAFGVEQRRLALFREGKIIDDEPAAALMSMNTTTETRFGGLYNPQPATVDMNVWWQTPQYLLIGLSEVFTSIGQLEFFYDQAPDVMRSCSMALQLLSVCIGSYLSGAVVWGTQKITAAYDPDGLGWLPKDLNQGRLDLFFLFLAGLMALNTVIFLWVARTYEYKAVEHAKRVVFKTPRPRPPVPRPPTAPMASRAISRAHAAAIQAQQPESVPTSIYGRSVTFMPPSPAVPAPFR